MTAAEGVKTVIARRGSPRPPRSIATAPSRCAPGHPSRRALVTRRCSRDECRLPSRATHHPASRCGAYRRRGRRPRRLLPCLIDRCSRTPAPPPFVNSRRDAARVGFQLSVLRGDITSSMLQIAFCFESISTKMWTIARSRITLASAAARSSRSSQGTPAPAARFAGRAATWSENANPYVQTQNTRHSTFDTHV